LLAVFIPYRWIYNYRIRDGQVQVVLFNKVPIRRVDICDIDDIRVASKKYLFFSSDPAELFAERWGNRMRGNVVVIKKSKGFTRAIMITPEDPEKFVSDIKRRISSRSQDE